MAVYAEIYDVVAENLQQAETSFEYGKHTFLCDVASHPQEVHVSRFIHLPNPEFVQAVYVAALKRLPDDRTVDFWKMRYELPKEEFQEQVLRCVADSSVVAINHIRFLDNPYFKQKIGLKYKLFGKLYGLTDKANLREFGKKLPQPAQRLIRKIFL